MNLSTELCNTTVFQVTKTSLKMLSQNFFETIRDHTFQVGCVGSQLSYSHLELRHVLQVLAELNCTLGGHGLSQSRRFTLFYTTYRHCERGHGQDIYKNTLVSDQYLVSSDTQSSGIRISIQTEINGIASFKVVAVWSKM